MSQKKIYAALNVLQEGILEQLSLTGTDLNFKIECKFLAQVINENYMYFYGVLKGCDDFYFQSWDNDEEILSSDKEIQELKPELLSTEMEDNGYVKTYCNCMSDYTGGNLYILAKDILIFDEDFQRLTVDDLSDLAERYWYYDSSTEG